MTTTDYKQFLYMFICCCPPKDQYTRGEQDSLIKNRDPIKPYGIDMEKHPNAGISSRYASTSPQPALRSKTLSTNHESVPSREQELAYKDALKKLKIAQIEQARLRQEHEDLIEEEKKLHAELDLYNQLIEKLLNGLSPLLKNDIESNKAE